MKYKENSNGAPHDLNRKYRENSNGDNSHPRPAGAGKGENLGDYAPLMKGQSPKYNPYKC